MTIRVTPALSAFQFCICQILQANRFYPESFGLVVVGGLFPSGRILP